MDSGWKPQVIEALLKNDAILAHDLKDAKIPSKLYKYVSFKKESFLNLKNDTLWLSNPLNFNDPYDSAFTVFSKNIMSVPEILKTLKISKKKEALIKKAAQEEVVELNDHYTKLLKNSVRICCFSENNSSILMWSHYAREHTGMCVEYNFDELPKKDLRRRWLFPVNYSNKLFDGSGHFSAENISVFLPLVASLCKNICWKYEKEWRLVAANGDMPDKGGLWDMPKVKAIYLGSKVNEKHFNRIKRIAKKKKIPLYQMKLDIYKFKMIPNLIKL